MSERIFAAAFTGVRDKEIYPEEFAAGDACPAELVLAAEEAGALEPAEFKPAEPVKDTDAGKGEDAGKGSRKAKAD